MPLSPPPALAQPIDPPDFKIDPALAERGRELFARSCLYCHGAGMVAGGQAPDLRESAIATSRDTFKSVVLDGAKRVNGMPPFQELKDEDIDGLMHFIRQRARETRLPQSAAK